MMADLAESASRSIEEPNLNAIRRVIHNAIVNKFLDGQFSACNITTKELDVIEKVLIEGVLNLKHQRIKYPGQDAIEKGEGKKSKNTPQKN